MQPRSDGTWIRVTEYKTEDGGTVAVYTDITEIKRREEELARKSTILEATMENMDQGISMFNADLDEGRPYARGHSSHYGHNR